MYEGTMTTTHSTTRADLDSQLATLLEIKKGRRRQAHGWLQAWGRERERIGSMGSVLAKVREMGDGAGSSPGGSQRGCNPIERQCDKLARTLRIEHFVRQMPLEWIYVLVGKYMHGETGAQTAARLGIERNRVASRIEDAQDWIMREFDADAIARMREINGLLQTACSSVESSHPVVVASEAGTGKPA